MSKVNKSNTPWNIILPLTLVIGFLFVQPFIGVIALSLLLAYVFYPLYLKFNKKMSTGLATTLTTIVATCIVIIPLLLVSLLTVYQLRSLVANFDSGEFTLEGRSIEDFSGDIATKVNDVGASTVGVDNAVAGSDVSGFIQDNIPKVLSIVADFATGLVSSVPAFFTLLILFLFLFTASLTYHEDIVRIIKTISPFDDKLNKKYLQKIGAMSKAMLKGQMIIAIAQGLIGAASLLFLGLSEYFFVFAVAFSFLNLIPLGSGLLIIPIGIIALFTGNLWAGIIILFTHFVITSNVDNLLRPKLVPDEAYLPTALLILSAFAGVALFGLFGVVYGPIIMIILTTTIDAFIEHKNNRQVT